MKSRFLVSFFVVALSGYVAPVGAVQINGIRMHEAPDYTRVVFDTSGPLAYDLFVLKNPGRVVIDLKNARPARAFDSSDVMVDERRVRHIRTSPRGVDYRVVLDVAAPVRPDGFVLKPVHPYGHRLVVDLYDDVQATPEKAVSRPVDDKRDVVIAIDAGHGGEDPGAIGPGGVREKDVVLSIARRVNEKLNRARGFTALLIREGDYYIKLENRRTLARKARADLFLSIHADAFKSPEVSGASVYTLSDKGATSETAQWLAEKENRSDLIGGVGPISLDDKDDLLAHVLLDLSMAGNRSASIEAGEFILRGLGGVARLHKSRVEQAGFVVLKAPDVPSVLIETGYISNPAEARRLKSGAYQDRLANAIADGVRGYMSQSAPPHTLLAWQRDHGGLRYTIVRGDTLSGIAMRYGTSTRRLKEANGIANDRIRVGQVIVIP